ncbi:MAG: hypothetical protein M3Z09_16880 [Acidobacteriota bacterium]|nr:hypothetical protein [Acidobacteriota bacterium]
MQKPTATAMLPLLLLFLCGVTVGALAMSFVIHRTLHHRSEENKITLLKWKKELNLTDAQQSQLQLELDDFSKYYDNVLGDAKSRILLILDDNQKNKFERLLKERRKP